MWIKMANFSIPLFLLLQLYLLLVHMRPISAKCSKGDTTLATFNAGLVAGGPGAEAIDARATALIDEVHEIYKLYIVVTEKLFTIL